MRAIVSARVPTVGACLGVILRVGLVVRDGHEGGRETDHGRVVRPTVYHRQLQQINLISKEKWHPENFRAGYSTISFVNLVPRIPAPGHSEGELPTAIYALPPLCPRRDLLSSYGQCCRAHVKSST